MSEDRVRKIFYKHWANKSLNEALIVARKEIAEEILSDIFSSQVIGKERQELILKINDARGRIGYFTPYPIVEINASKPEYFKHLVFLYQTWEESMKYAHDNYELIPSDKFKEENKRSDFEDLAKKIVEESNAGALEFASNGVVFIKREQFLLMETVLDLVLCHVLLGENSFKLFAKISDKAIPILKKYQYELGDNKSNKIH